MKYLVHFTRSCRDGTDREDVWRVVEAFNAADAMEQVIVTALDDMEVRAAEPIDEEQL